ncbi:MAG: 30S ribosomal protein S6 [bacterium]
MENKFYDLMVIFDEKEAKREKITSEITGIINENNGFIEHIDEWGIKTLSYPIKKHLEGFYLLIRFSVKKEAISLISEVLRVSEHVLRFLITKRKKPLPKEEEKENEEEVKEE